MTESAWHNKTRLDIVEFYNNKGYYVDTSHGEGAVPLYFEKVSRATYLADVDILVMYQERVKYIIEIQDKIRPKDIIGIIGAINISTIYSPNTAERIEYPLKNVVLFIVYKSQKEGSKKDLQMKIIRDNLKFKKGCLEKFVLCTDMEFKKALNKV